VDKFEVYIQIRQLLEQGFTKTAIAKKLGISRPTLYRYLEKSPKEMAEWIDSTKTRKKKLDPYKNLILSWLREHPEMKASQVEDWLKERFPELKVSESTVRSYVRNLRKEYNIPKESSNMRDYEAIPDPEMGKQIQVDFGETRQKTPENKTVKLYFIAFVLSNSRYKYAEFLDRPFTTRDVIRAHENAFRWFEGIPHEIVYDQDSLIVVSENGGDLILTKEFEQYRQERRFNLHVCRKGDPESKGRIENVIGYIKRNFAAHRIFTNIDRWNENAIKWLNRTGNYKIHNTTKKRPVEVFQEEKKHLRPITKELTNQYSIPVSSITRRVRQDNTIIYKSNRYSVPLGTYNKQRDVYISERDGYLYIYASENGLLIAKHKISNGKGQLIQDTQHTRDRSKGIDAFLETVASNFEDYELAKLYLEEIRTKYPRYVRDQLHMILRTIKRAEQQEVIDRSLKACFQRKLFSATDFVDMVKYIEQQRQVYITKNDKQRNVPIKSLDVETESIFYITTPQRDLKEYLTVLEAETNE
jgi:transposase